MAFPLTTLQVLGAPYNLLTLAVAALNHEDIVVVTNLVAMIPLSTKSTGRFLQIGIVENLYTWADRDVPVIINRNLTQIHRIVGEGVGRV